ncbi:MAG: hypothetical protein NZ898_07260 [Myxococcota bacterium]|nr:hypothetical protein [Myxococcota bacterium]
MANTVPESGARGLLLCASASLLIGSCGVAGALADFGRTPPAQSPRPQDLSSAQEVAQALAVEVDAALARDPRRRPLAAADVVVSLLLVFAGLQLLGRRPTGPWWLTQACIANALHAVAEATSRIVALFAAQETLVPLLARSVEIAARGSGGPPPSFEPSRLLGVYVLAVAGPALVMVLLYAYLVWRVRRGDVGAVLGAAGR